LVSSNSSYCQCFLARMEICNDPHDMNKNSIRFYWTFLKPLSCLKLHYENEDWFPHRVAMSVMTYASKRCSVRYYLIHLMSYYVSCGFFYDISSYCQCFLARMEICNDPHDVNKNSIRFYWKFLKPLSCLKLHYENEDWFPHYEVHA
jgi:hypothetical protein